MTSRKVINLASLSEAMDEVIAYHYTHSTRTLINSITEGKTISSRELSVVEILRAGARLLEAWKYIDNHPEDPHAADSLDYAEDWLREAFLRFTGKLPHIKI